MKIAICWTHISGYMAACWRALATRPDVQVQVTAFASEGAWDAAFGRDIVAGLDCQLLDATRRNDTAAIRQRVASFSPDAVVLPGWLHPPYRALAFDPSLQRARFVMGMDTPLKYSWRQRLARFKIGRYLDRMHTVLVAGERAFQLARVLHVPEQKILRGVYGYDDAPLSGLLERRTAANWPHSFLFAGRYVEDKAIDVLLAGYAAYRKQVPDAWPLTCCGQGKFADAVRAATGVTDLGFVQPRDLPAVLLQHGVFVFVSRYEPWGVALAEAMASGLPAITSQAVGASVELVRHLHNGLLVPTDDPNALAAALAWFHAHPDRLPSMGTAARAFAIAHTAQRWAERLHERLHERLAP